MERVKFAFTHRWSRGREGGEGSAVKILDTAQQQRDYVTETACTASYYVGVTPAGVTSRGALWPDDNAPITRSILAGAGERSGFHRGNLVCERIFPGCTRARTLPPSAWEDCSPLSLSLSLSLPQHLARDETSVRTRVSSRLVRRIPSRGSGNALF